MPHRLAHVLHHADADLAGSLRRLFDLIKIPSISMDQSFSGECRRAAERIVGQMAECGIHASLHETPGQPIVIAHHSGPAGAPHILFYGHYDVQPPGSPDLWRSPPFEPALVQREGKWQIVGRGASDDKGALMTFLEACRAWMSATGGLPVSVTMIFEGEEEIGSQNLKAYLEEQREKSKFDAVFLCDTEMWNDSRPGITVRMRGLVGDEVRIRCADRDLHSGAFGGVTPNAAQMLARILASLHDEEGRVAIPGFYDGVEETSEHLRESWGRLEFDEAAFLHGLGLSQGAGEAGRSFFERNWTRPTCEINGMIGGYTGSGLMTVIPSEASAKISFRLVEGQDPERIRRNFRNFVASQVPVDCDVSFHGEGGSKAVALPASGPWIQRTCAALKEEWGEEAALIGMGGSIPIVTDMQHHIGGEVLLVGFAKADDRIHAPDEKYDLSSFHKGIRSWIRILAGLG